MVRGKEQKEQQGGGSFYVIHSRETGLFRTSPIGPTAQTQPRLARKPIVMHSS